MIEETNKSMDSNLSKLRASIEAQRVARENIKLFTGNITVEPPKIEIQTIPEIIQPDNTEFSLERHFELCNRANVLYNNYLYWKEFIQNVLHENPMPIQILNFEDSLKQLTQSIDDVFDESCKIRFS